MSDSSLIVGILVLGALILVSSGSKDTTIQVRSKIDDVTVTSTTSPPTIPPDRPSNTVAPTVAPTLAPTLPAKTLDDKTKAKLDEDLAKKGLTGGKETPTEFSKRVSGGSQTDDSGQTQPGQITQARPRLFDDFEEFGTRLNNALHDFEIHARLWNADGGQFMHIQNQLTWTNVRENDITRFNKIIKWGDQFDGWHKQLMEMEYKCTKTMTDNANRPDIQNQVLLMQYLRHLNQIRQKIHECQAKNQKWFSDYHQFVTGLQSRDVQQKTHDRWVESKYKVELFNAVRRIEANPSVQYIQANFNTFQDIAVALQMDVEMQVQMDVMDIDITDVVMIGQEADFNANSNLVGQQPPLALPAPNNFQQIPPNQHHNAQATPQTQNTVQRFHALNKDYGGLTPQELKNVLENAKRKGNINPQFWHKRVVTRIGIFKKQIQNLVDKSRSLPPDYMKTLAHTWHKVRIAFVTMTYCYQISQTTNLSDPQYTDAERQFREVERIYNVEMGRNLAADTSTEDSKQPPASTVTFDDSRRSGGKRKARPPTSWSSNKAQKDAKGGKKKKVTQTQPRNAPPVQPPPPPARTQAPDPTEIGPSENAM